MSIDLQNSVSDINSKLSSIQTYNQVSKDESNLKKNKGNSLEKFIGNSATQLNKISSDLKRFQRNTPNSFDSVLDMIFKTRGSGSESVKYIRKKLLEVMVKMEPKINEIITESTIKALGCSQEQTYPAKDLPIPIDLLSTVPNNECIYIPVKSLDFLGNLTIPPESLIGKFFYEKEKQPNGSYVPFVSSTKLLFKPYGGQLNIPLNRVFNETINNTDTLFSQNYRDIYKGKSQQNLFDFKYVTENDLGVSGDFLRVILINRNNPNRQTIEDYSKNKIGQFISDYFSTIKKIDPVSVAASLVNYSTNFIDIKLRVGYERASDSNKLNILIQRIFGLCFDSRREIDISGIAKIAELDGVDDKFFEFTEVDLRNIESNISNIQKGVITFEDCGNVELPVNVDDIIDDFIKFRDTSGTTVQDTVKNIEDIIDNISKNPNWTLSIPSNVDLDFVINKNILRDLPKAVAYSILTPKILFPVFLLLQVVEKTARNQVNQAIQTSNTVVQSGNSYLQSGTTVGQEVNNLVDNSVDFVKKFKTFVIETVSKINGEFLKELYNILRRDIINLMGTIIKDINKSKNRKTTTIILRYLQILIVIANIISDFRNCKSLIDGILNLLKLISAGVRKERRIPLPLLLLSDLLPGTSPERAATNVFENLERLGIPIGNGPGGEENIMNQFILQMFKGLDKEYSENGKVEIALDPQTGFLSGLGKFI